MSITTPAGRHGGISPGLLKTLGLCGDPPAAAPSDSAPAAPSGAIGPDTFHRIDKFHHCRIMRLPIGQRGSAIRLYLALRRDHPGTLSPADLITVKTDYGGLKSRYKLAGAACESGFRGLVQCGVLARKRKGFCRLLPQEVGEPAGFTRIPRRVARRANDLTPAALCLITLAWGREDAGPPPADASAHDRFVTLPKRLYGTLNMTDGGFRGAIKTLCRLGFIEPLPAAVDLFRLAGLPLTPDKGDESPAEEDVEGAPIQAIRAPSQAIGASPARPSLGLARPSLGLARGDLIEDQEYTNQERDQEKLRRRGGPSEPREAGGAQRPVERVEAEARRGAEKPPRPEESEGQTYGNGIPQLEECLARAAEQRAAREREAEPESGREEEAVVQPNAPTHLQKPEADDQGREEPRADDGRAEAEATISSNERWVANVLADDCQRLLKVMSAEQQGEAREMIRANGEVEGGFPDIAERWHALLRQFDCVGARLGELRREEAERQAYLAQAKLDRQARREADERQRAEQEAAAERFLAEVRSRREEREQAEVVSNVAPCPTTRGGAPTTAALSERECRERIECLASRETAEVQEAAADLRQALAREMRLRPPRRWQIGAVDQLDAMLARQAGQAFPEDTLPETVATSGR